MPFGFLPLRWSFVRSVCSGPATERNGAGAPGTKNEELQFSERAEREKLSLMPGILDAGRHSHLSTVCIGSLLRPRLSISRARFLSIDPNCSRAVGRRWCLNE